MKKTTRIRVRLGWLALALLLGGCGEASDPATDGAGATTTDGAGGSTGAAPGSSGGTSTGGSAASGGAIFDPGGAGSSTGGVLEPSGGENTGGAVTPTGGLNTGGTVSPSGGVASGGLATGGASTGGVATGGLATAGAGTGGVATGGVTTGGVGTGGVATGGTVADPRGMTLYYVRHAETVANALDDHNPSAEDADTLTELGQRQVSELTAYLLDNGVMPDAVLVSPALRSQRTIEPFLVSTGLVGIVWPELWECCGTEPTGAPLPTEPARYDFFTVSVEAQNLGLREGDPGTFWRIDTYEQGLYMVMQARDLLLAEYGQSGKTVLISGHAVSGSVLIGLLRGLDLTAGVEQTGPNAIYMMNTGVQLLFQDPASGLFELAGTNINHPATE